MKKILFVAIAFLSAHMSFAQPAQISRDAEGNKVVKGFLTAQELATDTAFHWFARNKKDYTPDESALQTLKANKDSVNIIAFGGTWCHDTWFVLPRLLALTEAAGVAPERITIIGLDENKKSVNHLPEAFNITNVPTIIVMKNGKELGRVIEYGKHGMFDRELGEVIRNAGKK